MTAPAIDLPWLLGGLLAAAVLLACVRLVVWQASAAPAARSRGWRLALLLVLQPVAAGLLYLTLLPPRLAGTAGTLVVATAAAPRSAALAAGDTLVALPEAPDIAGATRVPDLATALRRNPGVARLRIVGHGLPPRDRGATSGLPLAFEPAPLPRGLIALALPPRVAPGAGFRVGGSVAGVTSGRAELVDPAGRVVAAAPLPPSGDFVLAGAARVAGTADFALNIRDSRRALVDSAAVPVVAAAQPAPRMLVVAGAAGPDLKYLRRWAKDAGIVLGTSIAAGRGLDIGDAPARLDAASLAPLDLLVLDERSWATLSPAERGGVLAAVRGGLGLVLRVTGPVADATRRQWAALGLSIGDTSQPLRLAAAGPELTRLRLAALPGDTVPLLRDTADAPIAVWRGLGRGRIGLWPVIDLYALVLAGEADRHAATWSQVFGVLARTTTGAMPRLIAGGRIGERLAICDLAFPAAVVDPDGTTTTLLADAAVPRCAGFWPRRSGWHSLRIGADPAGLPFHVAPRHPGLDAEAARVATWRLQVPDPPGAAPRPVTGGRGAAWPWFTAWLLVSILLWWFERSRLGRPGDRSAAG